MTPFARRLSAVAAVALLGAISPAVAGAATHHPGPQAHAASRSRISRPKLRFRAPVAHQTVSHRNRGVRCQLVVHSARRIRSVAFRLDGRPITLRHHAPYTCSFHRHGRLDATKLAPGTHTVSAHAVDVAGHTSTTSVTMTVAPSAPVATTAAGPAAPSGSTAPAATTGGATDTAGPAGRVLWNGDLETGDFSQMLNAPWDYENAPAPTVVTDNVRSGRYAEKFTMPGGGFRTEQTPVDASTGQGENFHEGDDLFYGFSLKLGVDWPMVPNWAVITQWHLDQPNGGSVILGLDTNGGGFQLFRQDVYGGGTFWQEHPLITGRWVDFVVHIKFSSDPAVGFIELWQDGVKQTLSNGQTRLYTATWYPGAQSGWWKHGIYRDTAITQPATLWADSMKIATSYSAAAPS